MGKIKENKNKKNYAVPGEPMTEVEFKSFVEAAEGVSFLPEKKFKRKFEAWKKALEK
jgi:hypothetical protein